MWTKPWTFKEGFLIGGGLIFAGLMFEPTQRVKTNEVTICLKGAD